MDRRIIWLFVIAGSTVGGLLPEAWGGSAFGGASLVLSLFGGICGLWFGVLLAGY